MISLFSMPGHAHQNNYDYFASFMKHLLQAKSHYNNYYNNYKNVTPWACQGMPTHAHQNYYDYFAALME